MNSYTSHHLRDDDTADVLLCGHLGGNVTMTIGLDGCLHGTVRLFFPSHAQLSYFVARCQQALQDYDSQAAAPMKTAAE